MSADALVGEAAGAAVALFGFLHVGGGAADFGGLFDVFDAVFFVRQTETFEGLAELRFLLGQEVALLFVGDVDHDLPLADHVAQIDFDFVNFAVHLGANDGLFVGKEGADGLHNSLNLLAFCRSRANRDGAGIDLRLHRRLLLAGGNKEQTEREGGVGFREVHEV